MQIRKNAPMKTRKLDRIVDPKTGNEFQHISRLNKSPSHFRVDKYYGRYNPDDVIMVRGGNYVKIRKVAKSLITPTSIGTPR